MELKISSIHPFIHTKSKLQPFLRKLENSLKEVITILLISGTALVLWDAWDMNNFYSLFLLFSDFIGILFSFCFLFLLDDEEARDIVVT